MASYTSPFTGDLIVPTDVSYNSINLTQDLSQLIWADAGPRSATITDTFFTARIIDLTSTTNNFVLRLPNASEGSIGTDMLFRNLGSTSIIIHDATGTAIVTIAPGQSQWFYLTNNSTVGGVWRSVTFGTGISGANANDIAGGGLRVDQNAQLSVGFPVTRYVNPPELADADSGKMIDWVGSQDNINLPTPTNTSWMIGVRNNGSGELSLTAPSGINIDNLQSIDLLPGESTLVIYDQQNNSFVSLGRNRQRDFYFSISNWDITTTGTTINLTDYASIILSFNNSGTAAETTVYLPEATNTYYIINNSDYSISLRNGSPTENPAGNTVVIGKGEASTAVSDGTNVYATNVIAFGALTLTPSDKTTPGMAIEEDGAKTTGFWAKSGEAGVTVNNGAAYMEVQENIIVLKPGTEGQISTTIDGGYIA